MAKTACAVPGCTRPPRRRGYCGMHHQRIIRSGSPGEAAPRHAAPFAGRAVNSDGYIVVTRPGHPLAGHLGRIYEHRLVAWEAGILTDPSQLVHHINGDRGDNRPENLAVHSRASHASLHHKGRTRS